MPKISRQISVVTIHRSLYHMLKTVNGGTHLAIMLVQVLSAMQNHWAVINKISPQTFHLYTKTKEHV